MNLPYYPGCTLKANASHFEDSAIKALEILGHQLVEMKDWVCCGTVFSQTDDDLMLHLASIRNLLRAKEQGFDELVTLCSMCYNTLNRSKAFIDSDPENLKKVTDFMYRENIDYDQDIQVYHLFNILKDRIKYDTIEKLVSNPLKSLRLGAYYGCLLVRPKEFAIDDFEDPSIMEDFLRILGAEAIDYPFKLECCGAYQTLTQKGVSVKRCYEILNSAKKANCDAIVTSCPLCAYNLDFLQKEIEKEFVGFVNIPVFYFTELLALALGHAWEASWSELHAVDPLPLLKDKQLI